MINRHSMTRGLAIAAIVLVLCPPLHWWASGSVAVLGIPSALFYVLTSSLFVCIAIVAVCLWTDTQEHA